MSSRTLTRARSRDERHAHARGDEALDRQVVVALEGHARLEAGGTARAQEDRRVRARARGAEHPRLLGQLGQPQVALLGKRVARGQGDVHRVVEDVQLVDALVGAQPRGGDGHGDVDLTGLELRDAVVGLGEVERQLDAGMAIAVAGDGRRHDRRPCAGERAQPQPAAAQPGDRLELVLGVGQAGEDDVGVLDERAARLREAHAARAALDELRGGLALERGDLLGDGRLRVGQRVGGGGERSTGCNLAQHAHTADVEH